MGKTIRTTNGEWHWNPNGPPFCVFRPDEGLADPNFLIDCLELNELAGEPPGGLIP